MMRFMTFMRHQHLRSINILSGEGIATRPSVMKVAPEVHSGVQNTSLEIDCNDGVQMGTVTKIPGNTPNISTSNPVAENAGGSAPPEEAKPNA